CTTPEQLAQLTEREVDVLREIGLGLNNKEIAEKLFITEGTVKNHVSNLISKLELRDRTQAAIYAVRYGITMYT
ncbi:response regulator transcription factor, partial [Streptococcus agalactiae]